MYVWTVRERHTLTYDVIGPWHHFLACEWGSLWEQPTSTHPEAPEKNVASLETWRTEDTHCTVLVKSEAAPRRTIKRFQGPKKKKKKNPECFFLRLNTSHRRRVRVLFASHSPACCYTGSNLSPRPSFPTDAVSLLALGCARAVCVWIRGRRTVLGPRRLQRPRLSGQNNSKTFQL